MTIEELKGLFGNHSVLMLEHGLTARRYILKIYSSNSEINYPEYNGKQYIFITENELEKITKLAENSNDFIIMTPEPEGGEMYSCARLIFYIPNIICKKVTLSESIAIFKFNDDGKIAPSKPYALYNIFIDIAIPNGTTHSFHSFKIPHNNFSKMLENQSIKECYFKEVKKKNKEFIKSERELKLFRDALLSPDFYEFTDSDKLFMELTDDDN